MHTKREVNIANVEPDNVKGFCQLFWESQLMLYKWPRVRLELDEIGTHLQCLCL